MCHCQQTQRSDTEIFDPFPAPRGWQLGGGFWAGAAQQLSTTDFMTYEPAAQHTRRAPARRVISPFSIAIIPGASLQ